MAYLKQDEVNGKRSRKKTFKAVAVRESRPTPAVASDETHYVSLSGGGLSGIECALDNLADHLGDIAKNGYNGENKLAIFTGESGAGFHPVLIALEPSETMDRLIRVSRRMAKAFERIADAMTPKDGEGAVK